MMPIKISEESEYLYASKESHMDKLIREKREKNYLSRSNIVSVAKIEVKHLLNKGFTPKSLFQQLCCDDSFLHELGFTDSKDDIDILEGLPFEKECFDVVTLLAVIEHFASSPGKLLKEIHRVLKPNGKFILDTPNAASAIKRLVFLIRGVPPYPSIEDFFFSESPFTGHNREYTLHDLQKVLSLSGFEMLSAELFNLRGLSSYNVKTAFIQGIIPAMVKSLRNYIWVVTRK